MWSSLALRFLSQSHKPGSWWIARPGRPAKPPLGGLVSGRDLMNHLLVVKRSDVLIVWIQWISGGVCPQQTPILDVVVDEIE